MPPSNLGSSPKTRHFVGRQQELNQLAEFFSSSPAPGETAAAALIVGPGGIGKTYLASKAADLLQPEFPDGTIIVSAQEHGLTSAVSSARRILLYAGVDTRQVAGSPDLDLLDDGAILSLYRQTLSRHHFLIVIDEPDKISDVASLLQRAAPSGFILTARESPQYLPVGLTIPLSGLSPAEARQVLEGFEGSQIHEQESTLDQLTTRANGNPLLLALISAQLREGVSADSLASQLAESVEVTRTNSVEATIQSAYDALSEQSRRALRLLSAFGGLGFTTGLAAEVLAASPHDSEAELSTLQMRSFLGKNEPDVYQMHPLIQEFARKLLLATEDEVAVRRASEIAIRTLARHSLQSRTQIARDLWTSDDTLGYSEYARAVAEFIRHPETRAPLSIAVFGSWGSGKTSLMRMVQERLDPRTDRIRWTPSELALDKNSRSQLQGRGVGQRQGRSGRAGRIRTIDILRIRSGHEVNSSRSLRVSPPDETSTSGERWRGTVWFNPWKYENSQQLWAGLANEIILQVTSRLNRSDRQAFWIDLNCRRFDKTKVQQLMNRALFTRIMPSAAAAAIFLIFAIAGILVAHTLPSLGSTAIKAVTGGTTLVAGVALALVVIRAVRILTAGVEETLPFLAAPTGIMTPIKRSLQHVMEAGFTDPDYASKLGFLEFVQSDVANVLDLIATDEHPLVVFVDDLDRCSSGTISGVIEAINLFMAGEYRNCIFVLGLDPAIVAAHIESTYKDMAQTLATQHEGMPGLGWSFLDKFVQLPLLLPRPHVETLKTVYMSALLQSEEPRDSVQSMQEDSHGRRSQGSDKNSTTTTTAADRPDEPRERRGYRMSESQMTTVSNLVKAMAVRAPNLDTLPTVAREAESDIFGDSQGSLRPETLEAASQIFSGLYSDTSAAPSIYRGLTWLASQNPREIKRFVNLFRFYYFIAEQRRLQSEPITADEVAKVAALIIRWPQILGRLLVGSEKLSVLDRLERWIAANPLSSSGAQKPEDERRSASPKEWNRLLIDCQVFSATNDEDNSGLALQLHRFMSEAPPIARAISVLL
jgi:hypothetical protein